VGVHEGSILGETLCEASVLRDCFRDELIRSAQSVVQNFFDRVEESAVVVAGLDTGCCGAFTEESDSELEGSLFASRDGGPEDAGASDEERLIVRLSRVDNHFGLPGNSGFESRLLRCDGGSNPLTDSDESVLITMTHNGLIKRTNESSYRTQKRGGKGVIGMTMRESEKPEDSDFIEHLFSASTHDYLMFFTNLGRAYVERVHSIPDMSRNAKGKSIANVLSLKMGETVAALIRIPSKRDKNGEDITWESEEFLFFATQQGTVKKTALKDFANTRAGGIIAIGIEQGDLLIEVKLTDGKQEPVLITAEGMSIRFEESDVRCMGRPAAGVRGISLEKGDKLVGIAMAQKDATLLVAGENGIGKRTGFDEYRTQSRGGKGIITMKTGEKTGRVVGVLTVRDTDEMMLTTLKGQMVRIKVADVRECGRNTQGVKLIGLDAGDKLTSIAPVVSVDQEDDLGSEG
jgi:DNA gyrase subunit A